MPLLLGTWLIVANGHEGELFIDGVTPQGNVGYYFLLPAFQLSGPDPNQRRWGFWDESSQAITLDVYNVQFHSAFSFEGCQFQMPVQTIPGQDVTWNLAGLFTATGAQNPIQPNSRRNRFGWHAAHTQTI
jgi:hypothetical protein